MNRKSIADVAIIALQVFLLIVGMGVAPSSIL